MPWSCSALIFILGKIETKEILKSLTLFKLVFRSSWHFAEQAFIRGKRRDDPTVLR
jgi:hypothetical protein